MIAVNEQEYWTPAEEAQTEVRQTIREEQKKYKDRFDKKRYEGDKYNVGDIY